MKSNSRLLSLLLLIVFPLLTGCAQTVDIYVHSDDTWRVKSRLKFSAAEMILFRGVIQEFLVEITQEAIPAQLLQVDDWPGPAFDLLKSYYSNNGIEFTWKRSFNSYILDAKGQTLGQFENLLPGAIEIEPLGDGQFHLSVNQGQFNILASLVYQQTITLHGSKIVESNAPISTGGTAVWNNPNEIDVTFDAGYPSTPAWIVGLAIFLVLLVLVGLFARIHSVKSTESQNIG